MSTTPFEVDIQVLARALDEARTFAQQFVEEDFRAGFGPGRENGNGLKYPLLRLRGIGQITTEDERQLGALVDAVWAGAQAEAVDALADAIRHRDDASPLACLIAETTRKVNLFDHQGLPRALAGTIAGAYLGTGLSVISNEARGTLPRELVDILAAAGGVLAAEAGAILRQTETQWVLQSGNNPM